MNKQAKCQKTFLWFPNRMNRTLCNFVIAEKRRNSRNPSEKHVLERKFKRSWLGIEKIIFWAPARSVISLFEAFRKGGRWDGTKSSEQEKTKRSASFQKKIPFNNINKIENVIVKKTFVWTDQTMWNRVELRYFDWPVPPFSFDCEYLVILILSFHSNAFNFSIFWLITIFLDPTLSKIDRTRFLQCFFFFLP